MHDIKEFYIPFKAGKEISCVLYDIADYCKMLKGIMPTPFPNYLRKYGEVVTDYSKQQRKVKPKSFPDAYRTYIIDYRLNILFASLDKTGIITTSFSRYGKYGRDLDDYYYGDGSLIGDIWPPGAGHDRYEMMEFLHNYGFLPIEEMAMPAAVVYNGDAMIERRQLSQYQVIALMERYRRSNFIDWKKHVEDLKEYHSYF